MSVRTSKSLEPLTSRSNEFGDFEGADELLRAWKRGLTPDKDMTVSE